MDSLPEELLTHIFTILYDSTFEHSARVSSSRIPPAVQSLSLTSRKLRRVISPIMFQYLYILLEASPKSQEQIITMLESQQTIHVKRLYVRFFVEDWVSTYEEALLHILRALPSLVSLQLQSGIGNVLPPQSALYSLINEHPTLISVKIPRNDFPIDEPKISLHKWELYDMKLSDDISPLTKWLQRGLRIHSFRISQRSDQGWPDLTAPGLHTIRLSNSLPPPINHSFFHRHPTLRNIEIFGISLPLALGSSELYESHGDRLSLLQPLRERILSIPGSSEQSVFASDLRYKRKSPTTPWSLECIWLDLGDASASFCRQVIRHVCEISPLLETLVVRFTDREYMSDLRSFFQNSGLHNCPNLAMVEVGTRRANLRLPPPELNQELVSTLQGLLSSLPKLRLVYVDAMGLGINPTTGLVEFS